MGPLFAEERAEDDLASGTIYVLRSKSNHPVVAANRDVLHKIGVTGSKIDTRIANAYLDPTFLMADVEVTATYELCNINRVKLENLLHRVFERAQLDIEVVPDLKPSRANPPARYACRSGFVCLLWANCSPAWLTPLSVRPARSPAESRDRCHNGKDCPSAHGACLREWDGDAYRETPCMRQQSQECRSRTARHRCPRMPAVEGEVCPAA